MYLFPNYNPNLFPAMFSIRYPLTRHNSHGPLHLHTTTTIKLKQSNIPEQQEEAQPLTEPALFRIKAERDPDKLFHLFKANSHNPIVIENRFAFEDTVSRLAGASRFDHIEHLLEHHKCLPQGRREGFMIRIITLYGRAGMAHHALQTFLTMPLFGCTPTVKSFNATLSVLARTRHLSSFSAFLYDTPAKYGLRLDLFSVNIAVKCFCDLDMVDTAYSTLTKSGLKPDVFTYTTLIAALYSKERPVMANGVWNLMLLRGCPPNLATFNARVQFLATHGRAWQANSLLGFMWSVGVEPDAVTYNMVMKGFCLCGYVDMAERVFYAFQGTGRIPNQKIYQTMIHYMCRVGEFDKAFTMCCCSMKMGLFPSVDTLRVLVKGLVKNGRRQEAEDVLIYVKRRVPPFSISMFDTIRSGFGDE